MKSLITIPKITGFLPFFLTLFKKSPLCQRSPEMVNCYVYSGMTSNDIMQRVQGALDEAIKEQNLSAMRPTLRFHGFRSEGHKVETENEHIKLLSNCHFDLTGAEPEQYLSTCTTDLRAFHFYSNTVGTCYGPVAENIHGVDERVSLASIKHTLKTYALFIYRWQARYSS